MPPKKVEEPEKKPLIGRVGTNLKVGIVGVPNVGKSTFFNVLTKSQAAAENFPFCTIDPNENKGDCANILNKQEKKDCKCHARPLAATVLGINNTDIPIPDDLQFYNSWTDMDAQEAYLKTRPTSYVILGKPGTGAYTLGEALSKKLNCIHICPKNILIDEIDQQSPTAQCIDFNMRHNKVCQTDTILAIMKEKLESAAIKHRGFVISGFPLLSSNRNIQSYFDTLNGEESISVVKEVIYELIGNLKKKKSKAPRGSSSSKTSGLGMEEEEEAEEEQEPEIEPEENEDQHVELPKFILDTCSDLITHRKAYFTTKRAVVLQQIQNVFSYKPDIIIHITCSNNDVISKRSRKFFNYQNSFNNYNPFASYPENEIRWPTKYTMQDYSKPFDTHVFNPKYNCQHPINFSVNTKGQICNYKDHVHHFIEEKIKNHSPKSLIKLDGRMTIHQMMYIITERLTLLPIKPILLPEPLYLEDPPEDMDEFWKTVEELNVVRSGNVNFNRYPSPWYNRCPVELKRRRSVQGHPRFAVSFFKHIYILSCLNNMIEFCRNPRPFLKLIYLEPTCRTIVIGSKCSGKTMVSMCLSWLFDAPVISFTELLCNEQQKKYNNYAKTIFSEISAIIEDTRFTKWQNMELERVSDLNMWFNMTHNNLNSYLHVYKEILKREDTVHDISDDEDILSKRYKNLKSKLLFLPFLDDIKMCQNVVQGQNLLHYAPANLKQEIEKPSMPVLGDDDVTDAITDYIKTNDLQKEIDTKPEEIMTEIIKILKNMDEESFSNNVINGYSKFIIDEFPSELEYWDFLIEANMLPDYTIVLIENREVDEELIQHYINVEKSIKNYQERYLMSNDVLVKTKLLSGCPLNSNYLDMKTICDEIVHNLFQVEENDKDINIGEVSAAYSVGFEKLKENWEGVKLKLDEQSKIYIDVELEGKSDIEIIDEVLLKLRRAYCNVCSADEDKDIPDQDNEDETIQDLLTYNDDRKFPETNVYCPVSFYDFNILWEGKPDISVKYDNRVYLFAKEDCLDKFQKYCTQYQSYSKPFKKIPCTRICIVGSIGSGKSIVSKKLAKELGLLYVDYNEYINNYLVPKHFKKIGWQYENSFTDNLNEEENAEIQMDEENENYVSELLSNENELKRTISNYFERGVALPSLLTHKIIKTLWFDEPFKSTGILIDGFPKLPNDVEDMISCFCIPDLVIELEGNSEIAVERVSPIMFKIWKAQLKQAKYIAQLNFQAERKEWFDLITKKAVAKLIVDEVVDSACVSDEPQPNLSVQSTIFDAHPSGSSNVDPNLFSIYNELILEYPEPVDHSEWENPDDVLERINSRIEGIYEVSDENIQAFKDILNEQRIKVISINGLKSPDKVFRSCLIKLSYLRNRNESFLEQTFIINGDLAEMLILEGFFFFSKFYRMCPVHIYENPLTLFNSYNISKRCGKVFPIIHRAYIYFVSSEENVKKFRINPLKYIKCKKIEQYVEYPLRIGVIGPPKSGKSTLSAKLAKRFGLLCLTKGMALRNVLENMKWTELGSKITSNLQLGQCIGTEYITKTIKAATFDHRAMTHGYVFDGFPDTPFEASELSKEGLYPLIIFDLKTSLENVLERSQKEVYLDILKEKPCYPKSLIEYRFKQWQKNSLGLRQWIADDIQNIYEISSDTSKWKCFHMACYYIDKLTPKYHYYLSNYETKIVLADVMCISNEVFRSKMTAFKNFCPMCFVTNVFRHSNYPVNKKGVVYYNGHFYWVCDDHINNLRKLASIVPSVKKINIPEIPAVVKSVNTSLVYENGICIVTYAENLPSQIIKKGSNKFAALYKGHYYLFCQSKCMDNFMSRPHLYFDIRVFKEAKGFPELSLKKLPNLGYLEQTMGNLITEACCAVNVVRPKYLGLDVSVSGAIFIALYLKTHNSRTVSSKMNLYSKAYNIFEARCKLAINIGLRLRSIDNPFAQYPKYNSTKENDSGTVEKPSTLSMTSSKYEARRVPVPDERYDYLCQYHKPASKVPAFLNVVDIAGLVRGAAEGQGLGNAFLSHIKACDAIFNLCRAFDDEDVIHVDGDVNPIRDLETIGEELRLKDEEQLLQNIEKLDRVVNRGNDKKLKPEYDALMKIKSVLIDEKKHIRFGDWSAAEIEVLNKYLFLTSKPALYLVNLSEKDYIRKKNKWLPKLKEWIDKNDPGAPLIPFSGVLETKLLDMDAEEKQAFLKEHGIASALDKIIVQGYKALQLEYFFTAGADEVKAWTIQKGTKAPQAAGRIHTDFEKGFIMAEVMHFKDFKEEGSEAACKSAGKYRQQGRNYVVEDGDIIFFKFNAGAGLKDAKKK